MSNIYNIEDWASGTFYPKNSIVKNNGIYYYSLNDHTSGGSFNSSFWGGRDTADNGEEKYSLFWKISYGSPAEHNPSINQISFGNGYVQRSSNGINSDLLRFEINFENRDEKEITAITHFFFILNGRISFLWTPPPPHAQKKLFVCQRWNSTPNFKNNFSLSASLTESVI